MQSLYCDKLTTNFKILKKSKLYELAALFINICVNITILFFPLLLHNLRVCCWHHGHLRAVDRFPKIRKYSKFKTGQ